MAGEGRMHKGSWIWFCSVERFSFECRKVIGFASTTLHDWLRKLAPLFHPIRSKTKTIVTRSHTFSRVSRQPRWSNYFEFSVVHRIFFDLCDWSEWLLWCSFYDTQYQTRKTVFQCISKHREESWKYDAQRSIFDELRGVWKCDQTLP